MAEDTFSLLESFEDLLVIGALRRGIEGEKGRKGDRAGSEISEGRTSCD